MNSLRLAGALNEIGDTSFCFWEVWTIDSSREDGEPLLDYLIYAESYEEASAIVCDWLDKIGATDSIVKIEKMRHLMGVDVLLDRARLKVSP